jgi:hypothetical protein
VGFGHDAFIPGYLTLVDCPECNGAGLILRGDVIVQMEEKEEGVTEISVKYVAKEASDELAD